jgi:hypothetical protein
MKITLLVFTWLLGWSQAFQPAFARKTTTKASILRMGGFFDFDRLHGGGSGSSKDDLDKQWEVQQAILAERRGHGDKKALRQKYLSAQKQQDFLSGKTEAGAKIDITNDMFVEDAPKKKIKAAAAPKFKMPWDK